jgi:hypothetical protein
MNTAAHKLLAAAVLDGPLDLDLDPEIVAVMLADEGVAGWLELVLEAEAAA